jgi:L-fuculose-phosphate aldolase
MRSIDLRELKVITEVDLAGAVRDGFLEVRVSQGTLLTPSARDYLSGGGLTLVQDSPSVPAQGRATAGSSATPSSQSSNDALFRSPEASAIKEEIIRAGRKLWERQYIDGNGGNISARLNDQYVICTPALHSKGDLTMDDFALVDMAGSQVAGTQLRSSEIMLHLEIYKAVPQARAVMHCHPPHATAYAITGTIPPGCMIPEHEVLVGKVALAPYETPGTAEFAQTVLPYVRDHNMILLQNHGVVCWADTVTHAEWCVEVVDAYCRIIILASHLDAPLMPIPNRKAADLLEIKKKLGLPDSRYGLRECQLCDLPEFPEGLTVRPQDRHGEEGAAGGVGSEELESIVQAITDKLMTALKRSE